MRALAERMRMPGSPRTRLESDADALHKRRIRRLKKRIDTYRPGEPLGRSLGGRLRASSLDIHFLSSFARPQRPVICSSFSGYRAPSTLIFEAAALMSRRSSAVS